MTHIDSNGLTAFFNLQREPVLRLDVIGTRSAQRDIQRFRSGAPAYVDGLSNHTLARLTTIDVSIDRTGGLR